ncbi:MAG: M15 family metallopeptidase [Treponema sp.]|nr:M15 family metallopeptidase [Treponema sp.]
MPGSNNQQAVFSHLLSAALQNAALPDYISKSITENIAENPSFILDLFEIMQKDPYLYILVDKKTSLSGNYEPDDLIELTNKSYRVNRTGMTLREAAEASLEKMAAAAAKEGLTLLASSAYRSYDYQAQVYERNVRQVGQEAADRESARPGHSQHQLGLVVDFGSITDAFARTPEGLWLSANASGFGWSLSYPDGYEEVTGYRWESWHYRYVGIELAEFIKNYFDGIQQYALKFMHEWVMLASHFD